MRYLMVGEVLEIYSRVMEQSDGGMGILDLGALESAVVQPRMTFNSEELYPTIAEKASALGFSLIQNHPFVDGNKRAGHASADKPNEGAGVVSHVETAWRATMTGRGGFRQVQPAKLGIGDPQSAGSFLDSPSPNQSVK